MNMNIIDAENQFSATSFSPLVVIWISFIFTTFSYIPNTI